MPPIKNQVNHPCVNGPQFQTELDFVKSILAHKTKEIRSLNEQVHNLSKADMNNDEEVEKLEALIDKWTKASQEMLYSLQRQIQPRMEIEEILKQLGIEHDVICYDSENGDFY